MELIKATESDLEELLALYQRAADRMEADGLKQWQWGVYPTEELIRQDVAQGLMYIQRMDNMLAGAVALFDGTGEPEYDAVEWTGGLNPGYFHRLVVDPQVQGGGIAGGMLDDIQQLMRRNGCDCIRCDTAIRNRRAMRLYEKMGFRSCGYIDWGNGEQNIALNKPLKRETPVWPIRMKPAYRSGSLTPWGGEKLRTLFGKDIPEIPTGESLEVSCIPGLESTDGMGRPLPELIRHFGEKLVGRFSDKPFPLLLKLIDTREPLSVQVHPGDAYAALNENGKLGKTEAWLILDAPEDGGELIYGIKPGVSAVSLMMACEEGGSVVESLLHRVKVRRGDVCYIPAGCIHSIGAGIVLYEIQQSSDLTYRFYDWNRKDEKGEGRELHLKKALDVANLKLTRRPVHVERSWGVKRVLNEEYFTLDIIQTEGAVRVPDLQDFGILTSIEGDLTLWWQSGSMRIRTGETIFLPANAPELTLKGIGIAALSMPA